MNVALVRHGVKRYWAQTLLVQLAAVVVGLACERHQRDLRRVATLESEVARLNIAAEQSSHVKDELLGKLSHELRTPLNAILGWLQLLRVHIRDSAGRAHAVSVIERNAREHAQVVADLLDVSSAVTGTMRVEFEPVDLGAVVAEACETVTPAALAKDVYIETRSEGTDRLVHGDQRRLVQVFWNLVNNAVKFTQPGGHVVVRVRNRGADVEVAVIDSGIGIDRQLLSHVFDSFHQADATHTRASRGLGLGLALVRHIVELHGGAVDAWSAGNGRGATFMVRLPQVYGRSLLSDWQQPDA